MGPTNNRQKENKDYCKAYRQKNLANYREKDAKRKKTAREYLKLLQPGIYDIKKKQDAERSKKTPRQFAEAGDKLVAIDCLYLPEDGLLNEPDNIKTEAPKIPDTLKIHKMVRKVDTRNITYL